MTSASATGRSGSLAADLVRTLTERIAEGRWRPGDRIPTEAELGEEHGVSRTVVREALSRLQAAGLVETLRGKGSFVLTPPSVITNPALPQVRTTDDMIELWELRLSLEETAARYAAQRRSAADVDRLRRAAEVFADSVGDPGAALQADLDFHRTLATLAKNRHLVAMLDSLGPGMILMPRERIAGAREAAETSAQERHQVVVAEHAQIVTAVTESDSELAAAAVRMHLTGSRRRLLG